MKVSKKGVSLAFVIVVVLALVILSSVLFTAAARSISLTAGNTDGREAYLKAKSAIEYAKTQFYLNVKNGHSNAFSVSPSGDGFAAAADRSPDGTSCIAECSNPTGDGKTWKISAKAKYRNSAQYRMLSYSFTVQMNASVTGFLSAGGKLGGSEYIAQDGQFENPAAYPVVIRQSVYTTQPCTAPEMYFLNPGPCFKAKGTGTYDVKLTGRLFYFAGTISTEPPAADSITSLTLHGMTESNASSTSITNRGYAGLVFFHNATIQIPGKNFTLNGAYYFKENTNLFCESTASLSDSHLVPVPQADLQSAGLTLGGKTLAEYSAGVKYIESNTGAVLDAGSLGAGWLSETKFNVGNYSAPAKDVSIFTDDLYNADWNNAHSNPISYQARSIQLLKQAGDLTIEIPDAPVTFQAGTFWFCAQKTASYPWTAPSPSITVTSPGIVTSVPYDVPCIRAATVNSKCFLSSPDGTDVTVILPRGLVIQKFGFGQCLLLPAGTYSVTSGTDLLTLPSSDWQTKLKKTSDSFGGGYGGFSITSLGYSNS